MSSKNMRPALLLRFGRRAEAAHKPILNQGVRPLLKCSGVRHSRHFIGNFIFRKTFAFVFRTHAAVPVCALRGRSRHNSRQVQ